MSIIIRNSGQKRDQGENKKQLYTWVGCGLVVTLTLVSVISNIGAEDKPDYSKFASSRMQDLASMPFGTDAELNNFLSENPEYDNISNKDLLGSLFSSEEREDRKAKDEAEGVPPPPDPEYKAIALSKEKAEQKKQIREERRERAAQLSKKRVQYNSNRPTTNQNKLSSSSGRVGTGSASTSVTGTIWRDEGKNIKSKEMPSNHAATAKDVAFAKNMGKNTGFYQASVESLKAGNASDLDTAAQSAIDAFQDAKTATELEKDKEEAGLDELPTGLNEDLQDQLKRDLGDDVKNANNNNKDKDKDKNQKTYNINENCIDTNGEFSWKCMGAKLLSQGLSLGFDYVKWGAKGGWKENKARKECMKEHPGDIKTCF